jgi:hypothetical protein
VGVGGSGVGSLVGGGVLRSGFSGVGHASISPHSNGSTRLFTKTIVKPSGGLITSQVDTKMW